MRPNGQHGAVRLTRCANPVQRLTLANRHCTSLRHEPGVLCSARAASGWDPRRAGMEATMKYVMSERSIRPGQASRRIA